MGFFRKRAKAKNRPVVDDDLYYEEEHDVVIARHSSKDNRHHHRFRDRYHHEDDYREAEIQELSPEPEPRDDGSVGETLATEDHFDLHIPVKPRRGILRNRREQGSSLLPPGHHSSKHWNEADSVSSISCDSQLLADFEDDKRSRHRENQTISMRSIKSRQSQQRHAKHASNNRPDPTLSPEEIAGPIGGNIQRQPPYQQQAKEHDATYARCCFFEESNERIDIETRIPSNNDPPAISTNARTSNTVRGFRTPKLEEDSFMNSTIPTFATEYDVALKSGDTGKDVKEISVQNDLHSTVKKMEKNRDGSMFRNFCGPRPEDLVVDDTIASYTTKAYRVYEAPLLFEKRDRSLFDPFSYDDDEIQQQNNNDNHHERRDRQRRELDERETSYVRTSMAMMDLNGNPMESDERDDGRYYSDDGHDHGYYEDETDHSNHWRGIRLPKKLPKVRNALTRMSSLSRLKSFRSSCRSQRSIWSGSRSRGRGRRRYGASPREHDESSHNNNNTTRRRRSRSRGFSPRRRSRSNSKRMESSRRNAASEEYLANDQGRRYYR